MPESLLRKPAVSGQFYSSSPQRLKQDIGQLIDKGANPRDVIGCIMPHAGYIYSGSVAGRTVSNIIIKDNVILLGPNHRGYGASFSIMTDGYWQTPLGKVQINAGLAKSILDNSGYLTSDTEAHIYEHSLEVELPFLQYYKPDIQIVPIVVATGGMSIYKDIGRSIALALKASNQEKSTLIVASSDMTHYEPRHSAEDKDKQAIAAIIKLDEDELVKKIISQNISMCGYIPTIIMMVAAKLLGAKKAELISYQTSGDVTGDYSSVVGYAGIIIE